jgi:putative restriction endonuclease
MLSNQFDCNAGRERIFSRYRMIGVSGATPLDAAHIHQFKQGGSNHPTNGIALTKTAHWLFDRGF